MPSYDPRSPRPLKPASKKEGPNVSELMSYGHVYFALHKKVIQPYVDMLPEPKKNEQKVKAIGEYVLPVGFEFKRDPEIPGGFRSISQLPDPIKIEVV